MASPDRDRATKDVINDLKRMYREKLLPVEESFKFDYFHSPLMTDAEFESKPQVLLVGQYSTGKTSFVRYLLGTDFPSMRIGPEPTTDRFVAIMHADDEKLIPGNALCMSPDQPYRGLEKFGMSFLNKFEGSQLPCRVLENITLIDTPGILAGVKQREDRGYDFQEVCSWFAERCDLILLLFDGHKLDISDEFKGVIEKFKGQDDKVRCILNKADQIDRQRLMRVYGALMWAMGKVLRTPEVLRVYIGSFWNEPLEYEEMATLFEKEENDLMNDLRDLPRNSAVRKINELVKRARLAKVNAHIISHLKSQMPSFSGKAKKQEELIADLDKVFRTVMKTNNLPWGDFPDINLFRAKLADLDFTKFPKLKKKHLDDVEELMARDIPRLMEQLPRQLFQNNRTPIQMKLSKVPEPAAEEEEAPAPAKANPFAAKKAPKSNPFAKAWAPAAKRATEYDAVFTSYNPVDGKLDAESAKEALLETKVDMEFLFSIWELSDHDGDGMLDIEEFALAMYFVDLIKDGQDLPEVLPPDLVPPAQR